MRPAILFPDVELWATGYLRATLAAHGQTPYVSNSDDTSRPARVVFRQDGGYRANETMMTYRFGCRVFAVTEQTTSDLARLVAALLQAATGSGLVSRVNIGAPFPVKDESGPMQYLTGEITTRGTSL